MLTEKDVSSRFHRPDFVTDPLYVITPIFNPQRYRNRWKLYHYFEDYILDNDKAHLVTIECTFGRREKAIVEKKSCKHTVIHVQTEHELWVKENLINIAIQSLPADWKYVAWVDADIQFSRPDWVGETIQQLQHYHMVQMFSESLDLSPDYEVIKRHKSFMYCYKNPDIVTPLEFRKKKCEYPYQGHEGVYWHPGFAWAARREAVNALGGLIDWSVLGGGDMFMAYALIGALNERTMPASLGESGIRWLYQWQELAEKHIKRNVGYVSGSVVHFWHGKKTNRRYNDRGQILVKSKYNPETDIIRDWQGVYQLNTDNQKLRDGIRAYFRQRNEDGLDD